VNALEAAVGDALGVGVAQLRPISGGDINDAYLVCLDDGQRVFVKTHSRPPPGMFSTEAHGLAWLEQAGALRVPRVLAVSDGQPAYLILEYLESARPTADYDTVLGEGLAALHGSSPGGYGLERDNFIGSLPQSNRPCETWSEFLLRRRWEPQVRRALEGGCPAWWSEALDQLAGRLDELLPSDGPHRLHGDLWGGNVHVGPSGQPCLIDPSVYGGHREVDLAMMRLFGGFSERVFGAYEAAAPLQPGAPKRVELYQLYPLLVHVNLFGGSYVGSVDHILRRFRRP